MKGNDVDLAVSGPEGDWIENALSTSEFSVRRREVSDLTSGIPAPLVVVAAAEGVKEALDALSVANQPIVILLGWSEEDALDNATLFLERPVSISNLVRTVDQYLGPTSHVALSRPPERTVNLPEVERANINHTLQLPVDRPEVEGTAVRLSNRTGKHSRPTLPKAAQEDSFGAAETDAEERVSLSKSLTALLLAADQQIFSVDRPADWTFPKATKNALELVPDSLLASVSLPSDPLRADPLEVFTYLAPAATIASLNSATFVSDHPALSFSETARNLPSVDKDTDAVVVRNAARSALQSGSITSPHSLLELFWAVHERSDPSLLTLEGDFGFGRQEVLSLGIRNGTVCSFVGEVWVRALGIIGASSRENLDITASNDAVAESRLRRAVAAGDLDAFALDRAVRLARQQMFRQLLNAEHLRYALRTPNQAETTQWMPVSSADFVNGKLMSVLAEVSDQVDASQVSNAFGAGEDQVTKNNAKSNLVLSVEPKLYRCAVDAGIASEFIRLVERHDGRSISNLIDLADSYVGLRAALLILASANALSSRSSPNDTASADLRISAPLIQRRLLNLHSLSVEADYFSLLGVSPSAGPADIDAAYQRRHAELNVPLVKLGLENLEDIRTEALDAIEDAYELLKVSTFRQAYADSLTTP